MGRLLAILLLIQISLPGFCCFANRAVRSTASLVGLASSDGSLLFLSKSCCGNPCCTPDSSDPSDCCTSGRKCCNTESTPNTTSGDDTTSGESTSKHQNRSSQSDDPVRRKVCECLDSDPMIPPSMASVDIDSDHQIIETCPLHLTWSSRSLFKTARYHPPPIRRHLFLCVIRC
jgi:hypothetical protein